MSQQIVILHEEDVNKGSLLCWLQIHNSEYLLQYLLVFYFCLWLFGLIWASRIVHQVNGETTEYCLTANSPIG